MLWTTIPSLMNGLQHKMSEEYCYECGGELEVEVVGIYRDIVCQNCGIVVDSEEVVEDEEAVEDVGDEYDVMV